VPIRSGASPTKSPTDHAPVFLGELVDELRVGLSSNPRIKKARPSMGMTFYARGSLFLRSCAVWRCLSGHYRNGGGAKRVHRHG
jgi:hypothetical protein